MKKIFLLIFLSLSYVCFSQIGYLNENDINFKDIVEKKGLMYFKFDSTLVTGRVVRFNRKNEAKSFVFVENGIPDASGWNEININDIKYINPILKKPFFDRGAANSNDWNIGQTQFNLNRENMNLVNNDRIKLEKNYTKLNGIEIKKKYIVLENNNYSKKDGIHYEYHENGQLKSKVNYLDGKKIGQLDTYHSNGQLQGRVNYIDGKEDGEMMVYNEKGEIMIIGFFKEGSQTGEWNYYENGKLIHTESFN